MSCSVAATTERSAWFGSSSLRQPRSRHLIAPLSGALTTAWYSETRGLGAYCGKPGVASSFVHYRVGGRQRKTTLGQVNELAIADARAKAAEIMLAASQGRDVEEELTAAAQSRLGLADAFAEYTRALQRKEASPRTLLLNEHNRLKMLVPYGSRALRTLTRREIRTWHEGWGQIGPAAANQGARLMRAVYNYADKRLADDLPASPCVAVVFF